MKATESKTTSTSRTFRSAEPFFKGSSADLQLKPAFEREEDAPGPSADVHRRQALEGADESASTPADVHRKAAFESDEEAAGPPVQMKRIGAESSGGSAGATSSFKTLGDGGFLSDGGKPFFSVSTVQPKLKIGHPNDRFEREADETADQVVKQSQKVHAPPVQRQDDETGEGPIADLEAPLVQQSAGQGGATVLPNEGEGAAGILPGDGDLFASYGSGVPSIQQQSEGAVDAGSDVESRLYSTKGQGRPLDEGTRTEMESSFGADFSGVNVHTGSDAIRLSNQLGAEAFTHGNDIYFNERKYSPESPKGRHLLAHELTHTVQQGASVRRKAISRTGGARIQRGVISNLINRVLRHVPGWTLLTVILGKNPVTGDAVPRTATNILDGLLGLLPGGAVLADKLRETGALEEAGNWLGAEVDKLGITLSYIKGLISQAWDELSVWNSWSTNLGIVKRIFGEPYRRIKTFVGNIAGKIKEFIFRGALKLVGAPVDTIMGILNKGADVLGRIISDPIGFFRKLGSAVGGGIRKFVANIQQHLVGGLIEWLTGAMSGLPITLPTKFDAKGIIHLVLQILGLTWDNIRGKLVKRLGDKVVSAVEKGVEIVQKLRTEGPMALWDMIKEKAAEIKQQVMDGIRNWVITQVVKQAVIKLLSFINPAGALVQAAIGLYNLVMFFYENMSRIIDFVRSIFNSVGEIARGAVAKASTFIETAMARTIPIILNFLARLIGLSGIGKAVSKIIKKIRKPVDKAVDKAIDFVVKKAKSLFGRKKGSGPGGKFTEADKKAGLGALHREEGKYVKQGGITYIDAQTVAKAVKKKHRVFKTLKVIDGKDSWDYKYVFRSEEEGKPKAGGDEGKKWLESSNDAVKPHIKRALEKTAILPDDTWDKVRDKTIKQDSTLKNIHDAPLSVSHKYGKETHKQAVRAVKAAAKNINAPVDNAEAWVNNRKAFVHQGEGSYGTEAVGLLRHQMFVKTMLRKATEALRKAFETVLQRGDKGTRSADDIFKEALDQVKAEVKKDAGAAGTHEGHNWVAVFPTKGRQLKIKTKTGTTVAATMGNVWVANNVSLNSVKSLIAGAIKETIARDPASGSGETEAEISAVADKVATAMSKVNLFVITPTDIPRYLKAAESSPLIEKNGQPISPSLYGKIAEKNQAQANVKYNGEIHHLVPLYLGGSHRISNLLAAQGKAKDDAAKSVHRQLHGFIDTLKLKVFIQDQTGKPETVTLNALSPEEIRKMFKGKLNLVIGTLYTNGAIAYRDTEIKVD